MKSGPKPKNASDRLTETVVTRVTTDTKAKLDRMCNQGPYKITINQVVTRGITLAIEEWEKGYK